MFTCKSPTDTQSYYRHCVSYGCGVVYVELFAGIIVRLAHAHAGVRDGDRCM